MPGPIYADKVTLFALQGSIIVHFVDGQTLEGEYITQDAYNIFLKSNNEPVMIPRQHVRLIKSLQGRPVEVDTSQTTLLTHVLDTQPLPPTLDQTLPTGNIATASPLSVEDEDEGTLVLVPEEEDNNDGTLIIIPEIPQSAFAQPLENVKEELDMTVILGEAFDLEAKTTDEDTLTIGLTQEKELAAKFSCVSGPYSDVSFKLTPGITTIGRSSDNVIVLNNDKEVSRHHVIILHESGQFVIQDQNSLNGTFVNDEPITSPHYLTNGDMILIGLSTFKYEDE